MNDTTVDSQFNVVIGVILAGGAFNTPQLLQLSGIGEPADLARFGIEPHETPITEFPKQPSRKDGLGTMCTEHWRACVKALREARKATAATDGPEADAA